MKFVITMNCDNDAFAADPDDEAANILMDVVAKLRDGWDRNPLRLMDANGNVVGSAEFIHEEKA